MFTEILIERELKDHPRTERILRKLPNIPVLEIEKYEKVFGSVRKPYLQKRKNLRLILANKRGQLVKSAPPAYGHSSGKHFYFMNSYNCIYECEYCYLQGYFDSPDIVFFLNHDEITQAMDKALIESPDDPIWFHAGEFSDSLALCHLNEELESYWNFFADHPRAVLELRTKSANLQVLRRLPPLANVVVSVSLAPAQAVALYEHKTPRVQQRLGGLRELQNLGFKVALHFDPIVLSSNFEEEYQSLLTQISGALDLQAVEYFSLGVVRFTKEVFREVNQNYSNSKIFDQQLRASFDGKVRYSKPLRTEILKKVRRMVETSGVEPAKIYLCME